MTTGLSSSLKTNFAYILQADGPSSQNRHPLDTDIETIAQLAHEQRGELFAEKVCDVIRIDRMNRRPRQVPVDSRWRNPDGSDSRAATTRLTVRGFASLPSPIGDRLCLFPVPDR